MGNLLKKMGDVFRFPSSDAYAQLNDSQRDFPIQDAVMLGMLEPMSVVAMTGTSTLNFYIASTVCPRIPTGFVRSMLAMTPFSFAPIGILGVVLSTSAVKSSVKSERMVGMASLVLMTELIYTVLVGGVTTALLSATVMEKNMYCWGTFLKADVISVLALTLVLMIVTIAAWIWILPYPKFGRSNGANDTVNSNAAVNTINEDALEARRASEAALKAAEEAKQNAKLAHDALEEARQVTESARIAAGQSADAAKEACKGSKVAREAAVSARIAAVQSADAAKEACKGSKDACEAAESAHKAADQSSDAAEKAALRK